MLKLDLFNLICNIINIIIILVVVRVFLFKPVKKILAKRKEEIDAEYANAKAAEDKANELKQQAEDQLTAIEESKKAAVAEARTEASNEYDRIVGDAKKEAEQVVENAKRDALQEKEKVVREAREEIGSMVLEAAGKIVASGQGAEADKQLYDEFLAKTGDQSE